MLASLKPPVIIGMLGTVGGMEVAGRTTGWFRLRSLQTEPRIRSRRTGF